MKKYRRTKKVSLEGLQLKKRVGRNRRRAKFVGIILLLATLAVAVAVAILPMLSGAVVTLKITDFWKAFKGVDLKSVDGLTEFVVAVIYGLMLLGVIWNALRAIGKLKKLFRKKGTKKEGFNHSANAMNALGDIFSGSFAVVLVGYFLINIICKDAKVEGYWLLILLGGATFIHLFTSVIGAKICYFDIMDENRIVEERRQVGRFAPFFRNVLQLAAVFGIMYFLLQANAKSAILTQFIDPKVADLFKGDINVLIVGLVQVVALLCVFVLAKHATAITEYNIDGTYGHGMKNFRVFSFFTVLTAGGAVVCKKFLLKESAWDTNLLIVAAIALVMFIIELMMRKLPKLPGEKTKKEKKADDSISLDEMANATVEEAPAPAPVENKKKSKKEKKAEKKAMKEAQQAQPQSQVVATLPQQAAGTTQIVCPIPQQVAQTTSTPAPQAAQQAPVQVHVQQPQAQPYPYMQPYYYPVAVPQPQVQQQPAPAPAPSVHILPIVNWRPEDTAAQAPAAAPAPVAVPQAPVEEEEEQAEVMERVEGPRVEVNCPNCGKRLRVNSGMPYHRCPACDRVFAIRGKSGK